jgi:hypothetical protein
MVRAAESGVWAWPMIAQLVTSYDYRGPFPSPWPLFEFLSGPF